AGSSPEGGPSEGGAPAHAEAAAPAGAARPPAGKSDAAGFVRPEDGGRRSARETQPDRRHGTPGATRQASQPRPNHRGEYRLAGGGRGCRGMNPPPPLFSQIKALVAAVRRKAPDARVIGIREKRRWTEDRLRQDGPDAYRIEQCDSPLAARVALLDDGDR